MDREQSIIFFQLLMQKELIKMWGCTEKDFAELELKYDLFGFMREQFDYLKDKSVTSAVEDIDEHVRELINDKRKH